MSSLLFAIAISSADASGGLSLDEVLAEVRANAPAVLVGMAAVEVSRAAVGVAGAWEDAQATVMLDDVPFERMGGDEMAPMLTYRLEQPLNLFGRRAAAKRGAAARVDRALARLRRTRADVEAQAVQVFYELWMNDEMRALAQQQIDLMERMRESAKNRYAAGLMMAHHDYLRADAELKRMQAELAALGDERRAMSAMLNTLRGRSAEEAVSPPVLPPRSPPLEVDEVARRAEGAPEVAEAQAMRAEMEAERDLAERMLLPMVMLGAQYQQRLEMEPDAWGAMLVFSVPLFFWDRQANEIDMASAEVRRAEAERRAMLRMSEADLRMAYGRARGTERALDALETAALPAIRETLRASRAEYVSGQGDFLRLLETADAALGLEAQRLELVARLGVQRFEIERLAAPEGGSK